MNLNEVVNAGLEAMKLHEHDFRMFDPPQEIEAYPGVSVIGICKVCGEIIFSND